MNDTNTVVSASLNHHIIYASLNHRVIYALLNHRIIYASLNIVDFPGSINHHIPLVKQGVTSPFNGQLSEA